MCEPCIRANNNAVGRRSHNHLCMAGIVFVFMFIISGFISLDGFKLLNSIKMGYGMMGFYCGMVFWGDIRQKNNSINNLTIVGTYIKVITMLISLVIAAFIGPFIAPFMLYNFFSDYKKSQRLKLILDEEAVCANNTSGL